MLTLQYLPYAEIEELSSEKKIQKIMDIVKKNRIVILEGKLKREEELELITQSMESIDEHFKGIELGSIDSSAKEAAAFIAKIKKSMMNMLIGDRLGMTIIGPASIVKKIKQDPEKIQVMFLTR